MASQAWVKQRSIKILREEPNIGAKALRKKLQDTYNVKMEYHTVWKGKEKAMDEVFGTWGNSFQFLFNFKAEMEKRDPGSIVEVDTIVDDAGKICFHRFFMALKPCIDGFISGCRPYLSIDSTALNGKWNGHLASCTALDGHNWMFPIAIGFIDGETEDNWTWFMEQVRKAIGPLPLLAVSTDACKGLYGCYVASTPTKNSMVATLQASPGPVTRRQLSLAMAEDAALEHVVSPPRNVQKTAPKKITPRKKKKN